MDLILDPLPRCHETDAVEEIFDLMRDRQKTSSQIKIKVNNRLGLTKYKQDALG